MAPPSVARTATADFTSGGAGRATPGNWWEERSCKCSQQPGSRLAAMQLHYHHVEHLHHHPAGWQLGNLFLVVLLIKVSSAQLEISHGGLTVPNMLARPDSLYHKWESN